MQLVVHGGAGGVPDDPKQRQRVLDRAVAVGTENAAPLTAAVTAVGVLEADPRFNAGVGSAVQSDGTIRTDAGLMTSDGRTGAACSMPGVEQAASVARVVAEETPHVLVSGQQAVELAEAFGIPTGVTLWSPETRRRWAGLSVPGADTRDQLEFVREQFGGIDTVGAVATDGEEVVAVTSTGGRWCALAGRVGDVPQIGAGFYASARAAASATGAGEAIARFGLARRVVDAIENGDDPETATDRTIRGFGSEMGAEAGVIAVDVDGRTGSAFNSEGMQTAGSEQ